MIKDKITPQLRNRFLQEIEKTIETGKEHGFLLCKDDKNTLSPSKSSVGGNGNIDFSDIKSQCPFKIQGDFHTHSPVSDMKDFIKKELPMEKVTDSLTRDITIKLFQEHDVSITGPSHGDLLGALVLKGKNKIDGTVCTSSDAEPNKMECWTVRHNIGRNYYRRAGVEMQDPKLVRNPPHQWIKPLFDREIINLK